MKRLKKILGLLILFSNMASATEPIVGVWHTIVPTVQIALIGKTVSSSRLYPPALATGHRLAFVRWAYQLSVPYGAMVWLCHPSRCVKLNATQGRISELAGLDAAEPLWFEFQRISEHAIVEVRNLQIHVQYR